MNKNKLSIKSLYYKLSSGKYFRYSFFGTTFLTIIFSIMDFYTTGKVAGEAIVALELAFTKVRVLEIFSHWTEAGMAITTFGLYLDFLYMISYSIFFASLYARISIKRYPDTNSFTRFIFILPFISALIDVIENIYLLLIMASPVSFSESLIYSASIVSSIKWTGLFIVISVTFICFLLVKFSKKK